jgi:membrane-associated phospholipid phosphatase
MIFGAFPSLHSGSAVMEALVMSHVFPKFRPYFFGYVLWIWWSTMYLTHHYFIDLTAGAVLSFTVFYFVKLTCLPQIQSGKLSRWAYDYIEIGFDSMPTKFRKSMDYQMYEVEQVQV